MQLSIVIVHYKVPYFIQQCLQSVEDACTGIDAEIIVVDNNSEDETCTIVTEKFPKVQLIANKENIGFSKANNQGVALARGEYVLILNPDTVVAEDTFSQLLSFAKNRSNIGAIGVKLIDGKGQFLPESKRGIPTPKVSFNKLFGVSSKQTGKYYASHLQENESGIVEILVGAFMFIKRSIYNEVKGFDETYFMYGEDIDLSYKIIKKGYQNYYYANTQVIHYKGESTNKDIKYLRYFYGAMKLFYKKHFKLNLVYDFFMSFGIRLWYVLKVFKLRRKSSIVKKLQNFFFYSKDKDRFEQLTQIYKSELSTCSEGFNTSIFDAKDNMFDSMIFDNNLVTNKEIITTIQQLKDTNISFRFLPKNSNFVIGSDSSNIKGEVVHL